MAPSSAIRMSAGKGLTTPHFSRRLSKIFGRKSAPAGQDKGQDKSSSTVSAA
ncbi:MAG: hypothetical protein ACR2P2_01285 [Nakamurella sp.]